MLGAHLTLYWLAMPAAAHLFAAATEVVAAPTAHSRPQKGVEHSAVHRGGSAVAGGLAAANEL